VSGFAGIIRLEPTLETAEADRAAITRMAEAIAFRGPDAQQQFSRDGASFAFSLLTTGPAPQAAEQPVTLDGETWLVGDVRLDGRRDLIESLNQHGQHCGPRATDEEIVLQAWKLWRKTGVQRVLVDELHGDYSFVLWEPQRRELHCFRDVMGGRPFYYSSDGSTLSFGNTLRAIHHVPGLKGDLDGEFMGDFLLVSWCPRPTHTVYRSIRKLPAGHWLTFSPTGLRVQRFQQLPADEPLFLKRSGEYVETYRTLLREAVADRLPNGPAGIFLSGGLDSTTVAATVCSLRKEASAAYLLYAISADLRPLFADEEGQFAQKAAAHFGIGFELVSRGDIVPFSKFGELARRLPEPIADPFWATYVHMCDRLIQKSRVMLGGYGGDNVLNNETWPYLLYLAQRGWLGRAIREFGGYMLKHKQLPPLRTGIRAMFRKWIGEPSSEPNYPRWLAPDFEKKFDLRNRWVELWRKQSATHPTHPYGYFTLTDAFWSHVQDKEDAAGTGLPMDTRSPLLDYRLLRFLLRVPAMPWCADKKIMRDAMEGVLPAEILLRKKSPLAQEPFDLHIKNGTWNPASIQDLSPRIKEFVDWSSFLKQSERLGEATHQDQWSSVPPVALNFWLHAAKSN
jgi:asparagine synthase (glutamine-hydrolysing)